MLQASGRSGRTRYGYVDPGDAAWEMFEEALNPFIDEMKKNQKRALPAVAKTYCIGIIKGLWRFDEESVSDFIDWVTDAPREYVHTVCGATPCVLLWLDFSFVRRYYCKREYNIRVYKGASCYVCR